MKIIAIIFEGWVGRGKLRCWWNKTNNCKQYINRKYIQTDRNNNTINIQAHEKHFETFYGTHLK